jgi:hypothetical protein
MTLPSFTADQSLYRSTRHYRSSARGEGVHGITTAQCGNGFLPSGSYLLSCVGCTCNDDYLSCYCYDGLTGIPMFTDLSFVSTCLGDVWNANGNLVC